MDTIVGHSPGESSLLVARRDLKSQQKVDHKVVSVLVLQHAVVLI